ncbi:toxin glutamine deamidase domain-containing protein [Kitasatospora sp. NPDC088351]|uniref:toxin glutamine deamidase domain-containing protein n=1 Tax=Kitasatospora sp. NPDC088351 TaxID=3155180 RepID=UPI003441597C
MSRKLPEELAPLLARTGHRWPQADEDGLRKAAGLWRELGAEAERLGRRGGDSARRVTGENSGRAVEAFGEYWRAFSGGGKGHLDDAHSAAGLVAGAFDRAARAVDGCKADVVAALTELAAELKQAEEQAARARAAAVKAAEAAESARNGSGAAPGGVFGGLAAGVRNTATGQVAEAMAAVAVEAARLRIGGLLDELGRAMKDGLATALKEPAVVALLRLGPSTPGAAGVRTASCATGPGGAFDPLAAGLPAALAEPGVLGAGGAGLAVVIGADGKPVAGADGQPVVGVPGLSVRLDEAGRPVLDEAGNPVIVRADGTPVADASGLLVVQGPDGRPVVGVEDLTVRLDEHGRPLLGRDGRPVLTDKDGTEVLGVPLTGLAAGDAGPGRAHRAGVGPDGVLGGSPDGTPPGEPGPVVPGAGPDAVVRAAGQESGSGGSVGLAGDPGVAAGGSGDGRQVRTGPVGAADRAPAQAESPVRAPAAPAHQSGGGSDGGDYTLAPASSHSGGGGGGAGGGGVPVTVRTDSVLAPPASAAPPSWSAPYHPGPDAATGGPGGGSYPGAYGGSYGGGYGGPVGAGAVGPGPLASSAGSAGSAGGAGGAGGYGGGPGAAGHGPAPFGSGIGAGAPAVPVALPGAGAPVPGQPGSGPAAPGQPAPTEPRPGAVGAGPGGPRAATGAPHPVTTPGPLPVPPPPVAPPLPVPPPAGPGGGRPEPHPGDTRRRPDGSPAEGQPGTGWGAVPVATAHAMALQLALRAPRTGAAPGGPVVRLRTIADSRPYGRPGGLAQVDPEHQREVERRAPRDGDGLPVRHPAPAAGGWAEAVNDGGPREPGRANNSLEIALSAVDTFTGRPTCAAPRVPTEGDAGERGGRDRAERELGAPFRDLGDGGPAFGRLAGELRRAGHGSQALLLTLDGFGRPHAWNAVNHRDTVTYLDHQVGRQGPAPLHDGRHGLWAIALDPEGRPLDLAVRRFEAVEAVEAAPAPGAASTTVPSVPSGSGRAAARSTTP